MPDWHARAIEDVIPFLNRHGLLLVGGYSMQAHGFVDRPSADLDFAYATPDVPSARIARLLAEEYEVHGYSSKILGGLLVSRLEIQADWFPSGESLEVDVIQRPVATLDIADAPVEVEIRQGSRVRTVSRQDAIGQKMVAVLSRFAPRDYIDIYAAAPTIAFEDLEALGLARMKGADASEVLEILASIRLPRAAVLANSDLEPYGVSAQEAHQLKAWIGRWKEDLNVRLTQGPGEDE